MAMEAPLYGLVISFKNSTTQKNSSKTISGINLPPITGENESAIGTDLDRVAREYLAVKRNNSSIVLNSAALNARRGVNGNG